jgi:hypothetical protein
MAMSGKRILLQGLYLLAAVGGGLAGNVFSDRARNWMSQPAAAAVPAGRVLAANEFDLVDDSGKIRAKLSLTDTGGGKLTLYDSQGQEHASIASDFSGGEIILSTRTVPSPENRWRVTLSSDLLNGANLSFQHPDAFPEVYLSANQDGTGLDLQGLDHKQAIQIDNNEISGPPFVLLRDHNGMERASLQLDRQGNPSISLFDHREHTRSRLVLGDSGDPSLSLFDAQGKVRTALGSISLKNTVTGSTELRSASSLVLFKDDGKMLWSVP